MLVALPHSLIELPVSDRVIGDTRLRQKARFVTLEHTQTPEGICAATITVLVSVYAALGQGYGARLDGAGFSSYTKVLTADNKKLVDAATGEILHDSPVPLSAAAWAEIDANYPQATMLQGDFFEMLRRYSPIDIEEMIVQHIQQADAMGLFA